jgi:hypothetical protein
MMTCTASDVKAARTFPCEKEIEHSRGIQRFLELCRRFKKCNKCYIRPVNGKNWTVFWRRIRMCGTQHGEESGRQRVKGIQAEELYSVEQRNRICEILCLRVMLEILVVFCVHYCFVLSVVSINAVIC